jgi:hypothetical protein
VRDGVLCCALGSAAVGIRREILTLFNLTRQCLYVSITQCKLFFRSLELCFPLFVALSQRFIIVKRD